MTSPRRRRAVVAGLAVAVLLAWLNGAAVWWVTTRFELFGATSPSAGDLRTATGACGATGLLLFVGLLVLLLRQAPWWLLVSTAVGVGTQLALAVTSYRDSRGLAPDADGTVLQGAGWALVWPGSWPLLAVLLVSLVSLVVAARGRVRGSSSPAPR